MAKARGGLRRVAFACSWLWTSTRPSLKSADSSSASLCNLFHKPYFLHTCLPREIIPLTINQSPRNDEPLPHRRLDLLWRGPNERLVRNRKHWASRPFIRSDYGRSRHGERESPPGYEKLFTSSEVAKPRLGVCWHIRRVARRRCRAWAVPRF
jgi:hypothetical protein